MNVPDGELRARFGTARRPRRRVEHDRPAAASAELVQALGKLSEALEAAEDARGHLYAFHRLSGHADLTLQDAVRALREAGRGGLADEIDDVLVGRDVIGDCWTFQLVEQYDEQYWAVFREAEAYARRQCDDGSRHVSEAELKASEQSRGAPAEHS